MAKTVTIRIISDYQQEPSVQAEASSDSMPSVTATSKGKKKDEKKDPDKAFTVYMGRRAFALIKSEAQFHYNKVTSMAENYILEANLNNALQTVDMAHSVFSMWALGSKMGAETAIGGAAGGAIGIAVAAIVQVAGAVRKMETQAQSIAQNAYGNYFYGERAGYVAGGHGTEN